MQNHFNDINDVDKAWAKVGAGETSAIPASEMRMVSLRQAFLNALRCGEEDRRQSDLRQVNQVIDEFVDSLPKRIATAIEKARTGKSIAFKTEFECSQLCPSDFDADIFRSQPGFQKLFQYCASPTCDIAVNVTVRHSAEPNGRLKEDGAVITVGVYPQAPFKRGDIHIYDMRKNDAGEENDFWATSDMLCDPVAREAAGLPRKAPTEFPKRPALRFDDQEL